MRNLAILFIFVAGLAINSFGQATATAISTGTIITPIAINKVNDMNFGNAAVNNSTGTVVLTPAGTRSATGGVTLPNVTGTVSAASFTVTGQGSSTYSITLPSSPLTLTSGSNSMTATTFTSTPATTGTLTAGTQTLTVGATLNVGASQPAGTYTSGSFSVTVNYN